jgi:hypothetical protein
LAIVVKMLSFVPLFGLIDLWCLMPLSRKFQLYLAALLVEETGVQRKTTSLPQVTDKFYHIMLY